MPEHFYNTRSDMNLPRLAKLLLQKSIQDKVDLSFQEDSTFRRLWMLLAKMQLSEAQESRAAADAFIENYSLQSVLIILPVLETLRPGAWDWTRTTNRNKNTQYVDFLRIAHYLKMADDYFSEANVKDGSISLELTMLEVFRLCDARSIDLEANIIGCTKTLEESL
jgi:hypothetical protein